MKAEDIKTWDDFLGAVKKLKAAGITPIIVGAGDKWPMHFYYSYLVMRIGGETRACRRQSRKRRRLQEQHLCRGGQAAAGTRRAGAVPARLSHNEIWRNRPGCLATARRRWSSWASGCQACKAPNSTSGKGLPEEDIGIFSFPILPGGKGKATDTLGGIHGLLVTKSAPPEAVDFLKFFSQEKYAKEAAANGGYIPVFKGSEAAITDPLFRQIADDPVHRPPTIRTFSTRTSGPRSAALSTMFPCRSRQGR